MTMTFLRLFNSKTWLQAYLRTLVPMKIICVYYNFSGSSDVFTTLSVMLYIMLSLVYIMRACVCVCVCVCVRACVWTALSRCPTRDKDEVFAPKNIKRKGLIQETRKKIAKVSHYFLIILSDDQYDLSSMSHTA